MSDREAEYRKETGKDIRPLDHLTRDWTMITAEYYRWLIQKLDKAEAERDELIELLDICRDLAAGGISYTDKYFRDKWEMDKTLADIDSAINRIREGK